ncbi:MAG: hypothetical protein ACR2OG_09775 [Gemmatimonadaceae bacterium]
MCPTQEPRQRESGSLPATSIWQSECDALIAGLAHALSNRLSTLSAAAQSFELGITGGEAQTAGILTSEVERLEEILRFLRELPAAAADAPEPIHVPELLAVAVALHRHHRDYPAVQCRLDLHPSAEPVMQPRTALLHALLLMLGAAKKSACAGGSGGEIGLSAEGDGATVTLATEAQLLQGTAPDADDDALSREMTRLLRAPAASFRVERSEVPGARVRYRLQLPSLGAMRREEATQR